MAFISTLCAVCSLESITQAIWTQYEALSQDLMRIMKCFADFNEILIHISNLYFRWCDNDAPCEESGARLNIWPLLAYQMSENWEKLPSQYSRAEKISWLTNGLIDRKLMGNIMTFS